MRRPAIAFFVLLALAAVAAPAFASGKLELYGVRMDPNGRDAVQYSRPGWGGGIEGVLPLPGTAKLIAGVVGIEGVNLLSREKTFQDLTTGLRVLQQTSQTYGRFYLGGQLGSHSSGFLRPYAGANVAVVWYGISTDVVVPDDTNRENEIRQNLRDENQFAFGWDANSGVDLNFRDRWGIDIGVRYLHAYGVPQQAGDGAVTIEPGYLQYRVGIVLGSHSFAN